ncbi:MAG: acyl-CoA thioesterase [Rhodobacteraceae bacterium]|nr:acyl-CoA thioesterase [Paracoccaceae bacterium]
MADPVHTTTQVVRFQHCDPARIVFYPRYFEMLNLTVEEFFENVTGWSFHRMHEELKTSVPTVHIETDFIAVSRLEDTLEFQLRVTRLGGRSLDLSIETVCAGEKRLTARITLVCVDFIKKNAVPWPEPLRNVLEPLAEE